ncbi:hypothetical protein BDZ45DRAFT_264045 [Acephala macrosclerotiorum]|nr:hypothetical protein BDZ45DRAFT_264045 [Acephala macrosclerotiorum]
MSTCKGGHHVRNRPSLNVTFLFSGWVVFRRLTLGRLERYPPRTYCRLLAFSRMSWDNHREGIGRRVRPSQISISVRVRSYGSLITRVTLACCRKRHPNGVLSLVMSIVTFSRGLILEVWPLIGLSR